MVFGIFLRDLLINDMMNKDDLKIDFVIPWVDGNDPEWQRSFLEYLPESRKTDDTREVRYRDWGLLRYWFRGVEKFAPWVNKIHLITCGHYPSWLNLEHPQLNFVVHSDYIPAEYLPTFSANPIELNLHRIKSLSEHFVYFNDDTFLIDKVGKERFFQNNLPCDMAAFDVIASLSSADKFAHIILNNVSAINQWFRKFDVLRSHWCKWFNPKYGISLLQTLALLPWPYFTGFENPHLPNAFLKSTLQEVWDVYGELLQKTSAAKFRSVNDYSQWLFRYWQLVKGDFYPLNVYNSSVYYRIEEKTISQIENIISRQKKQLIVLNDVEQDIPIDVEEYAMRICMVFNKILPDKSSFEK